MVKVTFDSNVLFDLKKLSENDIEGIQDLQGKGNINPHFNWPNFEEFIKGFTVESFSDKVKESRIFSKITGNGSVLETPNEIVRRECEIFCTKENRASLKRSREKILKVISVMRKIAQGRDMEAIVLEIKPFKLVLAQSEGKNKDSTKWIRKNYPKALTFLRTLPPDIWEHLFVEMMKKLSVQEDITKIEAKSVFSKVFSLRYRFAAYWGNVQIRMALGQQPPFGESNDTAQACYLSVVDYWVTNDMGAKLNLAKAEEIGFLRNGEATSRIITWQEYLSRLSKKELYPNLAPCKTSSYKYIIDGVGNVQFVSI